MNSETNTNTLDVLTQPIQPEEIEWRQWGPYRVFRNGKVYSTRKKRTVGRRNSKGYITFLDSETGKDIKVHQAVALCFLPNPNKYSQVNHKDGNKENNCVSNLEWCSQSHNIKHAYSSGLMQKPRTSKYYNSTEVEVFRHGHKIGHFRSQHQCARSLKISQGNLARVLSGHRSHIKSFTFKSVGK